MQIEIQGARMARRIHQTRPRGSFSTLASLQRAEGLTSAKSTADPISPFVQINHGQE
jgi:hypothetical protein